MENWFYDCLQGKEIWTESECREVDLTYFKIIRKTENYYEVMSKNTKHCWIILKKRSDKKIVVLYHKHSIQKPYYHKQREVFSVKQAISLIERHDGYVLRNLVEA